MGSSARPPARSRATDSVRRLHLLDGFRLEVNEQAIALPLGLQRVIAFVALRRQPVARGYVAGTLWLDVPEERAGASLRSALWRLHGHGIPVVESQYGTLALDPRIQVDLQVALDCAGRWMAGQMTADDVAAGPKALEGELLPDWYDDWIAAERERFRQLRLHALEAMAEQMVRRGRHGDALLAALAAVMADPLRESAHRALIGVHVAEGNVGEAIRQLRRYERLLADELGVAPSARLVALANQLAGASGPARAGG